MLTDYGIMEMLNGMVRRISLQLVELSRVAGSHVAEAGDGGALGQTGSNGQ